MHITMIKKRLLDGSECRKCRDASALLEARGLSPRIDAILWADEGNADSPGMVLGRRHGVEQAPFFIVRDERGEAVYDSVLQLIRERFDGAIAAAQVAAAIDPDDVGGI